MAVILGLDAGTTTVTALAVDADTGAVRARRSTATRGDVTPDDRAHSHSEWDPNALAAAAFDCLRELARELDGVEVAGLGLTGQQHGVVLVDRELRPVSPFVNWQDRRGERPAPSGTTWTEAARRRLGPDAPARTGCRLATGYAATTLFWLAQHDLVPAGGTACFITDYLGSLLTGQAPVTDATMAASSGVFDVAAGAWAADLVAALGLPADLLPPLGPTGTVLGTLTPAMARRTGLAAGLRVCVGAGDNQASFVGSVARPDEAVLVNVGTGGQVAARADGFASDPILETRPFPGGGFLLVCAGLCGGRAYALLADFFRRVLAEVGGTTGEVDVYAAMNSLAATMPPGAGGLRCEPFFTGTRHRPELRGAWTGVAPENLTPGHLARSLLEGMARAFREGAEAIGRYLGRPRTHVVGAGNGMRENALLARLVGEELGLPLVLPRHREEAAFGAALLAAVGTGVLPDLSAAGHWV
jgi:sugar (pentulose or hexulose) kinase